MKRRQPFGRGWSLGRPLAGEAPEMLRGLGMRPCGSWSKSGPDARRSPNEKRTFDTNEAAYDIGYKAISRHTRGRDLRFVFAIRLRWPARAAAGKAKGQRLRSRCHAEYSIDQDSCL